MSLGADSAEWRLKVNLMIMHFENETTTFYKTQINLIKIIKK